MWSNRLLYIPTLRTIVQFSRGGSAILQGSGALLLLQATECASLRRKASERRPANWWLRPIGSSFFK